MSWVFFDQNTHYFLDNGFAHKLVVNCPDMLFLAYERMRENGVKPLLLLFNGQ
jgi:hypothetical protein